MKRESEYFLKYNHSKKKATHVLLQNIQIFLNIRNVLRYSIELKRVYQQIFLTQLVLLYTNALGRTQIAYLLAHALFRVFTT